MNDSEVLNRLPDYLEDNLSPEEKRRIEAHLPRRTGLPPPYPGSIRTQTDSGFSWSLERHCRADPDRTAPGTLEPVCMGWQTPGTDFGSSSGSRHCVAQYH